MKNIDRKIVLKAYLKAYPKILLPLDIFSIFVVFGAFFGIPKFITEELKNLENSFELIGIFAPVLCMALFLYFYYKHGPGIVFTSLKILGGKYELERIDVIKKEHIKDKTVEKGKVRGEYFCVYSKDKKYVVSTWKVFEEIKDSVFVLNFSARGFAKYIIIPEIYLK